MFRCEPGPRIPAQWPIAATDEPSPDFSYHAACSPKPETAPRDLPLAALSNRTRCTSGGPRDPHRGTRHRPRTDHRVRTTGRTRSAGDRARLPHRCNCAAEDDRGQPSGPAVEAPARTRGAPPLRRGRIRGLHGLRRRDRVRPTFCPPRIALLHRMSASAGTDLTRTHPAIRLFPASHPTPEPDLPLEIVRPARPSAGVDR